MSLHPYRDEELNHFKCLSLVLNEFPKALRQTFKTMWDSTIGHRPGFQLWDDSTAVRNLFVSTEGGTTKVPTHQSYNEWDCTALFQATIFAKSFSIHSKTLADFYVKPRAVPYGSFHGSVLSPVGDNDETFALAIDQLRRLRNAVCHSSRLEMDKATFHRNIQYAKEAFKALGISTASIDAIGSLTASDFPTTKVRLLEQHVREENQAYITCLESRNADFEEIRDFLTGIKQNVEILAANKDEVTRLEQMIDDWKTEQRECNLAGEKVSTRVAENMISAVENLRMQLERNKDIKPTVPRSCLPSMVPNFTGRKSECQEIVDIVSSDHTRIVTIWGSPGFGKTSVGIAVGHQLQSQGFPVYFLSLRGLQTKADLTSKLFSLVRQPTTSIQRSIPQLLSFEDDLIETLGNISDSLVFILDNVDDLLESGIPKVKEDVLQLFEEILARNEKITLVVTTRESFEFMNLNFQGHRSIRIRPLDDTSSHTLVLELVPNASPDDCARIAQICGCVPLAMRLMCSLVCEDDVHPSQCLIEFIESTTESIVNILDNPDYPSNQRLLFLYESSFLRLSPAEKEAFVSLSVLPGCFTMHLASDVMNSTGEIEAKKMLQRLRRKSLLDSNSQPGTFTMHKLLQSFAREAGEQRLKEIVANAKCRFHAHYISRFEKLNDEFLNGYSMDAFIAFYEEKQHFMESLEDGCTDSRIAENVVKVLIKAELFLDSLFWCHSEAHTIYFNNIYDLALKAANALGSAHYQRCLLTSKAFGEITWGVEGSAMQLLKMAYEIQSKSYPVSDDERSKYLCYFGICKLVIGEVESGIQCLQEALPLMRGSEEHKILRLIVCQVIAVYYHFLNDPSTSNYYYNKARTECSSAADEQLVVIPPQGCKGKEPNNSKKLQMNTCNLGNWPMQFLVIFHVMEAAKNFFDTDTMQFVINPALQILSDLNINSKTPFHLFHFCGNVVELLGSAFTEEGMVVSDFEESVARHQATLEQFKDSSSAPKGNVDSTSLSRECNQPLARFYLCLGELHHSKKNYSKALYIKKSALDIKIRKNTKETKEFLAHSYHSLGVTQYFLGDFASAMQSFQRALHVRIKLFREDHASTAGSYHFLGKTQHSLGDFTSALESFQLALDVRIKLFGEDHASTADSYYSLGVTQCSLGHFTSALQSFQRALDVRIKLFGKDHASTADSYYSFGATEFSLGHFTSALQSFQRALDVRIKLFGEDHAGTADSYYSFGVTQYLLSDFTSALQSFQRALDVRIKLLGEDHASTADSYNELGVTQRSLGDFTSALRSFQRALDMRIKLFGEDHASTSASYHSLGVTHRSLGDFTSALQSFQRALDVRIKLLGEDHASTADSYHELGVTQRSLGDFTSALQSFQRALDVRIKLFGEDHASTADSYYKLGVTQRSLGDFNCALESAQRALDVRIKLFGEDHASTADSYYELGVTQHSLGDFTSALQSFQRALDVRIKLFGEDHASTADSYYKLGVTQRSLGDFNCALESAQREVDVRIKLFGEDHASTADSYYDLGVTQHSLGDFTSALQSFQRALDVRIKLFGEDHASTADSYYELGVTQRSLGDFTSALESAQRELDVRIKLLGEHHASTADSYYDLGVTQRSLGDFTSALQSFQRALDVRIKLFGEDHASTADSYYELGVTQRSLGDFTSALESAQRELDVRIKLFGEDHASTADSYYELGVAQRSLGDFTSALQSFQRALDVGIKLFGEDHASTADSYYELGVTQYSLGDVTSALQSFQRALDVRIKLFAEDHASTADSYYELGVTQHSLGDFTSALESAQRALDVRIKLFGEDHTSTADSYYELGVTRHSLGDFTSALQSFQRALDVRIKLFGEDHASTADSYYELGVTQRSLGDFTSALESAQLALDVRIKLFGEDHASTADSYYELGVTQHSLGNYTSALEFAQRELDVRIKLFGEDHASTADSYYDLGVTQHSLGDFTSALQSFQRALDVRMKLFGEDHASTADSYYELGVTQRSLGDFTSALESAQRALDVRIKLFGEDHASTADSYYELGVTQHSLGDFTSSLESAQR
ncbi:uncharacterized protein [Montipora capricornis]|uniref:uncharacterized protein n=1 Tax=Montipora capricornis TaxID=246305 RepID=UPI0035F1B2D4